MRKLDLKVLMDSLYDSDDYFVKIEPESSNYEEEYHQTTIDPDGNKRNLLMERSRSLDATKEITKRVP